MTRIFFIAVMKLRLIIPLCLHHPPAAARPLIPLLAPVARCGILQAAALRRIPVAVVLPPILRVVLSLAPVAASPRLLRAAVLPPAPVAAPPRPLRAVALPPAPAAAPPRPLRAAALLPAPAAAPPRPLRAVALRSVPVALPLIISRKCRFVTPAAVAVRPKAMQIVTRRKLFLAIRTTPAPVVFLLQMMVLLP